MATTWEKLNAVVDELRKTPPGEMAPEGRDLAELVQIAEGLGVDVFSMLLPRSPAEADVMVDKLLSLLFAIRGDDLPPFDPERYGEGAVIEPPE